MKYIVQSRLRHNGQSYVKGDPINLSGDAADRLLGLGVIARPGDTSAPKPKSRKGPKTAEQPKPEAKQPDPGKGEDDGDDDDDQQQAGESSGTLAGINPALAPDND